MAAQAKASRTAHFAARIAAAVPALVALSASAQASASLVAAKYSAITAVATAVLQSSTTFDAVTGFLLHAGGGLELCLLGDLVRALDFLQFSGSIWRILQLAGSVVEQSVVMHLISSAVSLFW
jgi:hypothetical protein